MNIKSFALFLLLACLTACSSIPAPPLGTVTLREVAGWPTLPPGLTLGQPTGVAVDSNNDVFVFHRATSRRGELIADATMLKFGGDSGTLLASWGGGMFLKPHGLSISADDTLWLTDVDLEQVFAFSRDGKLLKTLGTARVSGNDGAHFGKPADVAFRRGQLFVADGYTNTRVAVFGRDGQFTKALGGARGMAPGELDLPHGIAISGDRIYLADRDNSRLQIWTAAGKPLAVWPREKVGRPYGVAVNASGIVAIIDGGDAPGATRALVRLFDRNGNALATHDTRRAGDTENLGHDITFGPDGALYVTDIRAMRVVKLLID